MSAQRGLDTVGLRHRPQMNPFDRMLMTFRRALSMRILPPRRISAAERGALTQRIVADPEVNRALAQVLAARPQFKRKDVARADVQDRPA